MEPITANDPLAQSANSVEENIAKLKAMFPELVTEGAEGTTVNIDVLTQLIGGKPTEDAEEKYGLSWHGKRKARQLALTPSTGTLRPCPNESVDWDNTQNLMIEGDNLEVLKLLQKSYAGKVKLIYIDPPYNTGKDFVYPDNFQDNLKNYLEITGQIGDGGQKVSSNMETSGRFHTDWLNMIYPRLKLAWSLLRPDGVVFVSIDEKEVQHYRIIANELFGEENFVANVSVVTNLKGRNDKRHVAACHEQMVIYAKPGFISNGLPLTEEQRAAFKHTDEAGHKYALRDLRKRGGPDKREDRPKMYFPIYWSADGSRVSLERMADGDIEIFPLRGDGSDGRWRWGIEKVRAFLPWMHPRKSERSGRLDVSHRVYLDPTIKLGDSEIDDDDDDDGDEDEVVERTSKPKSIWIGPSFSSDNGKRSLKELLPGETFNFPKSVDLLRQCLQIGLADNQIVLDLFAGSGTMGQAVMEQNKEDGASRHFILVQLPEVLRIEEKDQKAAAKFCDEIGKPRTIAELTKERLRRAGRKIHAERPLFAGDIGFRVFRLNESNIISWDTTEKPTSASLQSRIDHIRTGRTNDDLLYEILLKLGLDLCVPIQARTIAGHEVQAVGGGVLMACLSTAITVEQIEALSHGMVDWHRELKPAADTACIFRDTAFENDVAKSNLAAILTQNGIATVRSL
jgi:adenine-specific DNA-methyltransferase